MASILDLMGYVQQQGDIGKARGEQQLERRLGGQVVQGDPAAYNQLAAHDPEIASKYQGAADSQVRRIEGLINLIKSAKTPQEQEAYYQQGRPFLARVSGKEPPATFAESEPAFRQAEMQIAMAKAAQGGGAQPAGFQELHMKALAAGLQPGTPEYKQAMNIALGREGRAATGGFGFEKVTGADGRERMGRTNPRTGVFEVYDETSGNFTPMGGGGALNGGSSQLQNSSVIAPTAAPQRPDMEADIAIANELIAAGVPEAQVDAFLTARGQRASQAASPQQVRQSIAVGPTPAEKSFGQESGQQAAQLQFLPQRGGIEAQNAAAKTFAEEQARLGLLPQRNAMEIDTARQKAEAEADIDRTKTARVKAPQLQNVERGLGRIDAALKALDSGLFGDTGPMDQYAQQFTPAGQELTAAVGAIQNDMLALTRVPGVGSQSDLEAKIANLKYPALGNHPEVNRRNLKQLQDFMADMNNSISGQQSGGSGSLPRPQTQADFDALPSGATYIDPDDGQTYRKP